MCLKSHQHSGNRAGIISGRELLQVGSMSLSVFLNGQADHCAGHMSSVASLVWG